MENSTEVESTYTSDKEIIELYMQRNEDAIKKTDEKYGVFIYRIAYNILHEHCDCEECKNDTYLGVWNAIPPEKPTFFRSFITKIMRRIAINKYYENTRKKIVPSELTISMEECKAFIPIDKSSEEEILAKELGKIISDFVRSLSAKRQYIFMSRFYLIEPVSVIAKELQITESAVYKELTKLKKELKNHLKSEGVYV